MQPCGKVLIIAHFNEYDSEFIQSAIFTRGTLKESLSSNYFIESFVIFKNKDQ
jgi:hypothetical protein